jgi:hypothetical protein
MYFNYCPYLPQIVLIYSMLYSVGCMSDEYEVKTETKYKVDTTADKIKAGAKAVAKKIEDTDRDLGTEYQKEKIKEKLD